MGTEPARRQESFFRVLVGSASPGGPAVPVLPLIDLMILVGSLSLALGFGLKAISITTRYQPTILGFSSIDMVIIAGICLAFALTLAARTWVKLNEPRLLAYRRRASEAELRWQAEELEAQAQAQAERREREASASS